MLERTTQPQTLIEKLEQEKSEAKDTLADISKYQHYRDLEVMQGGKIAGLEIAIEIVKQHNQETCNWRNNKGTGLWECHYGGDYTSDCGLEWNMSNKDSPSENEMHFCPKCGKKLVEVQSPSEVKE